MDDFTESAQRAEREVGSFGRSTKKSGATAATATNQMQRGFRNVEGAIQQANRQLSVLDTIARGVAAGIATIGLAQLGRDAYSAIAGSQQLQASLKTVTGSAEAASAAWAQLLNFAKETPYGLDQSVNAFIRMKSLGLDPTEAALRSFGNTASAMGKDLIQYVDAVADATTGELDRLKEFGITGSQSANQIAFTFQGVTTTVAKNSKAITGYLENIGNTTFAGAMGDQMATLNGQMSNLEDATFRMWLAVGDRGATDAFAGAIGQAQQAVEGLIGAINNGAFDWLFDAIGDINKQGDEFIDWVQQIHSDYTSAMNAIGAANLRAQASWIDMKATAVQAFQGIVGGAADVINAGLIPLQKALNGLDQTFANLLKNIGGALGPAGKEFLAWGESIEAGLIEPIGISVKAMNDYVVAAAFQSGELRNQANALEQASTQAKVLSDATDTVTRTTTNSTQATTEAAKALNKTVNAYRQLLEQYNPLLASQREYGDNVKTITAQEQSYWRALKNGSITLGQYNAAMAQAAVLRRKLGTTSEGFQSVYGFGSNAKGGAREGSEWDTWLESARTAFSDFDNLNKQAAESFTSGFGNAIEGMVFDFDNLGSAASNVFESIGRTAINTMAQMAAQSAIQAAFTASSWAPAAAATSISTFGGAVAAGMGALAGVASQAVGLFGFANGGYVSGPGTSRSDSIPAALSNGEFVVNAAATRQHRPMLEAMNSNRMMSSGTSGRAANDEGNGGDVSVPVTIYNSTDSRVTAKDDGNGGLTVEVMKAEFAKDMRTNGQMYQALEQNTNVQRKGR
ncbi:hypothetical protein ACUN9V_05720 [Salinicola sp. V024]|uniref:hypothetical protein n=1 Tax=Salinicola sp. V024 TaxID=3459609 RepID=UPI00404454C4